MGFLSSYFFFILFSQAIAASNPSRPSAAAVLMAAPGRMAKKIMGALQSPFGPIEVRTYDGIVLLSFYLTAVQGSVSCFVSSQMPNFVPTFVGYFFVRTYRKKTQRSW